MTIDRNSLVPGMKVKMKDKIHCNCKNCKYFQGKIATIKKVKSNVNFVPEGYKGSGLLRIKDIEHICNLVPDELFEI